MLSVEIYNVYVTFVKALTGMSLSVRVWLVHLYTIESINIICVYVLS